MFASPRPARILRYLALGALAAALLVTSACRRRSTAPSERRLISLTPSATELLAALGLADRLVGVDDYSKYPPSVAALPKIGSFLTPNLEAIVALRPSHVVADDVHTETAEALREAGIATLILPMHSLADVRSALAELGTSLGRGAAAQEVLHRIDAEIAKAREHRLTPAPRVLVVIDRTAGGLEGLVAAATGSWIDQLLALCGASNVLAASGVRYPKITLEEVLRADPEVILDLSFAGDDGAAWRTVAVTAAREGRVFARQDPFLISPSPRVPEALQALREVLQARASPR